MSNPQFKDYFSTTAKGYADYRPSYPVALAEYLGQLAPAQQLAWDCACGTGQLSVLLAPYFEQVIATDASSAQIQQAQPQAKVNYRVALAEQSGLVNHSVDLITVAQAAHWFDLPAFYAEARRVAKPDAVLALISYGTTEVGDLVIHQLVQYFYHQVIGQYWPPERQHIVDGYTNLAFPFKELSTPQINMQAEWNGSQLIGYLNTWSAVANARQHGQAQAIENFFSELMTQWGEPTQTRLIYWPLVIKAARL